MILVVGGTGLLGRRLVRDLAAEHVRVRVLARGVHPFPSEWPDDVERTAGDLRSTADCEKAVAGCSQVVFAASGFGLGKDGDPRSIDRDGAIRLTRAAAAAGVEHLVMMSMHGAAADAPIDLLRCKYAAEEALKASGMAWTIVRMGVLLEQWVGLLSESLSTKGTVMLFGSGTQPITFTSLADASAIVRRALADPALRGRTVEWGSQNLTPRELAGELIARAGRGTVRSIPSPVLHVLAFAARPFSPFLSRMAAAGTWMDSGALQLDLASVRAEFPDIPVRTLQETLQPAADA
ncbi:MAG: NAD(P)H-binding protein [Actinobacteria bacterium]|nr:NAD(P)H-binding protein [Actinomycetota bacterium]